MTRWPVLRSLIAAATLAQFAISLPAWAQLQTTIVPTLPALPDDGQTPQDDSPVICREPQLLTNTRLLGPRVCKTQRQWDDLHARGLDLGTDGKSTYSISPKYQSLNPRVCLNASDCTP